YKPSEKPLSILPAQPTLRFRADATYLLVGCLGGLGRSLTSWMTDNGARRFAFLSRSGTDQEQASILVNDLEASGIACQVIRGDAAVKSDVERAVQSIPAEFPIRGVVQAAMVLRVCTHILHWSRSGLLTKNTGRSIPFHVIQQLEYIHSSQGPGNHEPPQCP